MDTRGHSKTAKYAVLIAVSALLLTGCVPGAPEDEQAATTAEASNNQTTATGDDSTTPTTGLSTVATSTTSADEPVTIEFWTINLQANFGDYVQGLIDGYQSSHPNVTIEWVDVPGDEMSRRLLTTIAANNEPDVVNVTSFELWRFAGAVSDLNSLLGPEGLDPYFDELLTNLQAPGGEQLAIPWYHGGPHVAYYNQELIEQAGLSLDDAPQTYEEALEWGVTVFEETGVFGSNLFPSTYVFQEEGIPILNEDATAAAFNTPEAVDLLNTWKTFHERGATAPGNITADIRDFPEKIENEQVAFEASFFSTALNNVQEAAPSVFEKLEVRPAVQGELGQYMLHGMQTLIVLDESEAPDVAADFAAWVTSPENQLEFTKLVPIFPSTEATLEDPFFTETTVETPLDAARGVIVDNMDITVAGALGTFIDLEIRELFDEEIRAFYLGQKDAQTALDDAQAAIDQRLDEAAEESE